MIAAAERGTNELVGAVVGSTLTTVVVFVPLALLQGMVGQFFAALSLTLSGAVLLSLVYALLFIPVPAARFLRGTQRLRDASRLSRTPRDWLVATRYERCCARALARVRWLVDRRRRLPSRRSARCSIFRLETGFLPEMDEGGYVIDYVTPDRHLAAGDRPMLKRVEAVLQETPEVAGFTRRTGTELGMFATEQNTGDIVVRLKPRGAARQGRPRRSSRSSARRSRRSCPASRSSSSSCCRTCSATWRARPEPVEVKMFGDDIADAGARSRSASRRSSRRSTGWSTSSGRAAATRSSTSAVDPTRAAQGRLHGRRRSPTQLADRAAGRASPPRCGAATG